VLAASPPAVFPFLDNPLIGADFLTARLTAVRIMAEYLMLILWPARLSSDYSYAQIPLARNAPGDWIAWLAVCCATAIVILLYRRKPDMFFFGLFAFGTFLPASNLLFPIGTIMAERLLYLPALGLIACLVLAAFWMGERTGVRWFPAAVLFPAMLGLTVRTWERNPDWENNLTLAESEVRVVPGSFKAHLMLSRALYDGDPAHSSLERAIGEGERAVAVLDSLPDSRNTWSAYRQLAGYYLVKGDRTGDKIAWQRAIQLLNRAIPILAASPPPGGTSGEVVLPLDSAEAYRTLSGAWLRLSDPGKAWDAAVRARDLNPAAADSYRSVGEALRSLGRDEDAIVALMEGEMLTGDADLSPEVVRIYQARPDQACTLAKGSSGPEPNPACPAVRKDICAAVADAARIQVQLHREAQASLMTNRAAERYGCALNAPGR
jgi:tetratricopeptide (TPR) repeat protein